MSLREKCEQPHTNVIDLVITRCEQCEMYDDPSSIRASTATTGQVAERASPVKYVSNFFVQQLNMKMIPSPPTP